MNKPVSVDFQFSIKQRGRGAKKRIVEGAAQSDESRPALELIPRISRYMALAVYYEDLIRKGHVHDNAEIATLGHVTRARVTQIMNLRLLAPDIQEWLMDQPRLMDGRDRVSLKQLQAISILPSCCEQRTRLNSLVATTSFHDASSST